MTPRTVVSATTEQQTIGQHYEQSKASNFSRTPIHNAENKDSITGYVLKIDVIEALLEGRGDEPLVKLRRDIVAVDESFAITELFKQLTERNEHIAVVLDEFGGMDGIITMEDVIETILGMEIVDETDQEIDMRVMAQRHREKRVKVLGTLTSNETAE